MKIKWWMILIAVLMLAAVVLIGVPAVRHAWSIRQFSGAVNNPGGIAAQEVTAGAFRIEWDPGAEQITIRNQANPDRVVWQSVAGQPPLMLAYGDETVIEERAHYEFEEHITTACTEMDFGGLETVDTDTVHMKFVVHCAGTDQSIAGTLAFTAADDDQLDFHVEYDGEVDHNRVYLVGASDGDEHVFGFGEQFTYFDLKGRRVPIFVMEQGIGRGAQPVTIGADLTAGAGGSWWTSYASIPHYITSELRSLYLANTEYSVFDMRRADRITITVYSSELHGSMFYGETPADLIEAYTQQTGRMRPLPGWITGGVVVGMQGGTERVREVYEQLGAYDVPVTAFWLQDWVGQRTTSFGKQLWWNWELDPARYPGWDDLVADLDADGIRVLTYVSPFIADVSEKPDVQRLLFQEAAELGYLVQNADGDPYLITNTDFDAALVDLTNPDAREWYKAVIIEQVIGVGAGGFMADFGEALPYDTVLYGGTGAELHNQYPVLWAELVREAIEESGRDDLVAFHRSGFTESPRYATLFWLGDQLVSWDQHDGIKSSVTGLLSGGLSGYAYNHSDIGGYTTITNPIADYHRGEELLIRWMELNAFSVVYRTHEGNQPDNNVQFYSNETTLDAFARNAAIYMAWEFYRDDLVAEAAATGLPVVRHPFIHYPDDPNVYDLRYEQFLAGDQLLVVPVLDPETDTVDAYLPAGEWVHVWSGDVYDGGMTVTVDAPLGQPAVFYPVGSEVGETFAENLRAAGLLE